MTDRLVETPAILVWVTETVQLGDGLLTLTVNTITRSENCGDSTSLDGLCRSLHSGTPARSGSDFLQAIKLSGDRALPRQVLLCNQLSCF